MAVADSGYGKGDYAGLGLPFGYRLERDADLLLLRRADDLVVAAFSARGADLFEVELAVWEGGDQLPMAHL